MKYCYWKKNWARSFHANLHCLDKYYKYFFEADFVRETGPLLAHLGASKIEPGLNIFLALYNKNVPGPKTNSKGTGNSLLLFP